MKELTVWGMSLGFSRQLVATRFKKDAAKAFGVSVGILTKYASVTANDEEVELAMANPGVCFTKGTKHGSVYAPKKERA